MYLFQKFKSLRLIIVSNILLKTEKIDIELQFFISVLERPLSKGVTLATLGLSGYLPLSKHESNVLVRKGDCESAAALVSFVDNDDTRVLCWDLGLL